MTERRTPHRFVTDSEDEDPLDPDSTSLRFVTLPPKLVTSKSEGRANALPSKRRHLVVGRPIISPKIGSDQNQNPNHMDHLMTKEKVIKRYQTNSLESVSSQGSNEAAMNQNFKSPSTFSSSSVIPDEVLLAAARRAKKELETVAKRHVLVGRWKRMARFKPECQMFESVSKAKDQYSVVAKMNLPCSLREIMSVFSTDNMSEFHRSMEALFGDQYVYGVNARSVDCLECSEGDGATSRSRRASEPSKPAENGAMPPLSTSQLRLNSVSLMQRHRLVWKERNMTFLDYLDETMVTKTVTRVMETMDLADENLEYSSAALLSPTASSSQEDCSRLPPNQQRIERREEFKGIIAGYVIQEDSEEKFTRFFFYATHHHRPSNGNVQTKMPRSAVQLLRAMVNKVSQLEAIVLRRRLGYYPLCRLPISSNEAAMSTYCAACFTPFSLLRKRFFCRLCGHYTCRKCSDFHDIEKTIGIVEKHRVCASCVRRVSYSVFSVCDFPPKISSADSANSWPTTRTPMNSELFVEDEDVDPPIMDDLTATEVEDVNAVTPEKNGVIAEYLSGLLHGKQEKKKEIVAERRNRLQLTIDDLSTWAPAPVVNGQNTPKESISLLDSSFCTSSSNGSRSREMPLWLSPTA
ncbi:hypothetical protein PHYBOEH_010093 [Phytophthora boehmeriae]|uniref:FYVE-type domain-containing protein n=1 Tax=Phytophthora boehmeriae TaxID=109152 RepID=A0A8T1VU94_9STRA|nr:hypothetical protein PHYBOEH_010093 [Phytophthora boehmeriae]